MFNQVQGLALVVVLSILTLAVGAIVLQSFSDTQTANSYAANITADGLTSVDNVSGQYPVAGTLIGIGVLLAAIAAAFSFFRMRT